MAIRPGNSTIGVVLITVALVGASCASDDVDGTSTSDPVTSSDASVEPSSTDAPAGSDAPGESDGPDATDGAVTTEAPVETDAPVTTEVPVEYDFSAIGPIVDEYVTDVGLNGAGLVIVDADDGVVHEDYWGEFGPERISLVASSSKMITAGVLLALQDDGLLDIDAPISDAVDWGAGNPDMTVAQLLSNSSGLVGLDSIFFAPYLCQFDALSEVEECAASVFGTPDDDAEVVPPDTEFRYGGAQWQVAGGVAESVSGKSWAELIDEIYVEPCGLDALGYNNHFTQMLSLGYPAQFAGDPSTLIDTVNPNMEGGAYVTTGDYAELLLMHLRGGRCGDNQVLSQDALDTMHADRVAEAYDGDADDENTGYGMGWWVDRETGRRTDPGLYGSVAWLDLEDGYGAYLVIENSGAIGQALAELLYDEVDAAVTAAS